MCILSSTTAASFLGLSSSPLDANKQTNHNLFTICFLCFIISLPTSPFLLSYSHLRRPHSPPGQRMPSTPSNPDSCRLHTCNLSLQLTSNQQHLPPPTQPCDHDISSGLDLDACLARHRLRPSRAPPVSPLSAPPPRHVQEPVALPQCVQGGCKRDSSPPRAPSRRQDHGLP